MRYVMGKIWAEDKSPVETSLKNRTQRHGRRDDDVGGVRESVSRDNMWAFQVGLGVFRVSRDVKSDLCALHALGLCSVCVWGVLDVNVYEWQTSGSAGLEPEFF